MKKIVSFLTSMKTAVGLFIFISAVSVFGTVISQEAADRLIYKSPWFMAILFFLAASTVMCVQKRLPVTRSNFYSILAHAGIPVILAGGLIGSVWGIKGMMHIEEGQELSAIMTTAHKEEALPFSVRLISFSVEPYQQAVSHRLVFYNEKGKKAGFINFNGSGVYTASKKIRDIGITEIYSDFVLAEAGKPANRTDRWENPAVKISFGGEEGWLFAKYPSFHGTRLWNGYHIIYEPRISGGGIRAYTSRVSIQENGSVVVREANIGVNSPLTHRGWVIYQHSYDAENEGWTGLMFKKDPGVNIAYTGFILLICGLFGIYFTKYGTRKGG